MLKEFREFAMRGNVVDMAVGIIIGAAFGTIVKSLVDDLIMPPIGMMLGGVDASNFFVVLKDGAKAAGPCASLAEAKAAGAVSVNYGVFLNSVISFVIVAFAVFMLIRAMNAMRRRGEEAPAATTKDCQFCASAIPIKAYAVRCARRNWREAVGFDEDNGGEAMVVKRVGALSLAKVAGMIYALGGLFFGACLSLVAMAGAFSDTSEMGPIAWFLGVGSVVFLPIFYGVLGFVGSLVAAVLYNFIAGVVGGVEIDVA